MRSVCCALALAFSGLCAAQTSAALDDPLAKFADAVMLFEADAFGLASDRFERYLDERPLVGTADRGNERQVAELNRALAAQRAKLPEAEVLLESFVDRYSPQPIALEAVRQVADIAFAEKDYDRATEFYERIPLAGLTTEQSDEVRFRLGYTAFASKDFPTASRYLGDLRQKPGTYQEPATYYYALSRYYANDIKTARRAFEALKTSKTYEAVLPGYLAQLYFAEGDYEEVVAYAAPMVKSGTARQTDELALLVGRAYFELGRYEEALPFLEQYAAQGRKMSAVDFYQLGYSQYKTGAYPAAAANLKQLYNENTILGQQAMYYLGNAYLRQNQRTEARPAFASVSRMPYDATLREEAAWNVAKLNYELGYSQEALEALQNVPATSRHYAEAQALLARVILASRDYAGALKILNKMGVLTPELRLVKQRVLVLRGLQLLQEDKVDDAATLLNQSLENAGDPYYEALAEYWLGDISFRKNELAVSRQRLTKFLAKAAALKTALPDDANAGTANYTLGYVNLREEKYPAALGHFQEAVAELRRRTRISGQTPELQQLLGDAVMRAGDANFKRNDYKAAQKFYDEAITAKYTGYVYALYQRGIIAGLQGQSTEKIVNLEAIVDEHSRSEFADDALLELGVTYQSINQFKRAQESFQRLLKDYPTSDLRNEALLQLGLVTYNQGASETAINYYKQVFTNNPTAAEARTAQQALQEIYVQDLGRPNDYLAFLETVPGFKLGDAVRDSVNFSAATAQYQAGNYDRAVEQYTLYLKQFPKGGSALEALYRRAESYLLLKQYPAALKGYEEVIARGQTRYYEDALRKAAVIAYNSTLDFDKAYRYYAALIETGSAGATDIETQLFALRSASKAGKRDAVKQITDRLTAMPGLRDADRAVVFFYQGKAAYDAKEYDRALTAFNTVIRNDQGEAAAEARYLVARIYYLRRDLDLAESITIRAQRESSAYPYWVAKSTLLLIDIFLDRKDYLSANAVAEGLVANYKGDPELEAEARKKLAEVKRVGDNNSRVLPVDTSVIDLAEPKK